MAQAPLTPAWGRRVMRGAWHLSWSAVAIHGLSVVRAILLARLLAPELFGIVALAESLLLMLRRLCDFNFDTGLLQRRERVPHTIQANLLLKFLFSASTLLLIWFAHGWLARWYDPRVGAILVVLAAGALVQALGSTPRVLLERELRFTEMVLVQVVSAVIRTVVPVAMALAGWGLWSLVAAILIDMIVPALGFWWRRPVRVAARAALDDVRWFFRFSWPLWIAGGLTTITVAGSHVVVGSVLGATTLGLFSLAYLLARLPVQLVTHAISRATFPVYAALQQAPADVARLFRLVLQWLCWTLCPLAALMAALAPEAVPLLLGTRWIGSIPLLQSLCLLTVLTGMQDHAVTLFNAHGRTHWFRNVMLVEAAVLCALAPWCLTRHGALGMVWALNAMLACGLPCVLLYARRLTGVTVWPVVWLPLLISALVGGAAWWAPSALIEQPALARLVLRTVIGLLVGGGAAGVFGRAQLGSLWRGIHALWRGEWTQASHT